MNANKRLQIAYSISVPKSGFGARLPSFEDPLWSHISNEASGTIAKLTLEHLDGVLDFLAEERKQMPVVQLAIGRHPDDAQYALPHLKDKLREEVRRSGNMLSG